MKYNDDKNRIYVLVYEKYTNPILPQIPLILTNYLMNNPEKISTYINDDITIEKVLKKIHFLTNGNNVASILETIINCVEGDVNV